MAKIKLKYPPNEVYFKKVIDFDLDVGGKPLTVRLEEDSNEGHIHYKYEDGFSETPPEWITEMGEDDYGDLIFEQALFENLPCMSVGEEIYTHEDDEL
jgi:hypothetical protein